MRRILELILILFALSLAACSSEEGANGDDNPDPEAPFFNPVGTLMITAGQTLDYSVVANDPNDMNITLTFDGTLGPNANPFTTGAIFDPGTGNITWTTDTGDIGNYSLQITATNDAAPPLATNLNITISVIAVVSQGESLYNQHCRSCHGVNGSGGSTFSVQCSSFESIRDALGLGDPDLALGAMSGIAGRMSNPINDTMEIANFLEMFC